MFDLAEDINRLTERAYRRVINDNGILQKRVFRGLLVNLTQQKVVNVFTNKAYWVEYRKAI